MVNQNRGSQSGASLVEYALLVALIAVVAIGAVTFLGQRVSLRLSTVGSAIGGGSPLGTATPNPTP